MFFGGFLLIEDKTDKPEWRSKSPAKRIQETQHFVISMASRLQVVIKCKDFVHSIKGNSYWSPINGHVCMKVAVIPEQLMPHVCQTSRVKAEGLTSGEFHLKFNVMVYRGQMLLFRNLTVCWTCCNLYHSYTENIIMLVKSSHPSSHSNLFCAMPETANKSKYLGKIYYNHYVKSVAGVSKANRRKELEV